jgi:hypothetical protein
MRNVVLGIFEDIKRKHEAAFQADHGLYLKTGVVLDSAVIKLLKEHWSTSPKTEARNANGVFFGIWLDDTKPEKPLLRYNVHAKKFREAGYPKIAARDFAERFRMNAKPLLMSWPAINYPKGPGTLFEGHKPFDMETVAEETLALMRAFVGIATVIDENL